MKPRLSLPDVTVCAADTQAPAFAARALELCLDRCDFGDAILFSDVPVAGRFRQVPIGRLGSLDDYSRFCLRTMPGLIKTEFALVVQWDGYVVNPGAWAGAFRKYDYIGAPIYRKDGPPVVGNGGFSLRSRKLLDALPKLPAVPGVNEDWVISGVFRKTLENDFGVRFAPQALAERFSYEMKPPSRATFGFHGAFNLWRQESDAEVLRLFAGLPPSVLESGPFFWLLAAAFVNDRVALAGSLYGLARQQRDAETIVAQMSRYVDPAVTRDTISILEQSAASGPR